MPTHPVPVESGRALLLFIHVIVAYFVFRAVSLDSSKWTPGTTSVGRWGQLDMHVVLLQPKVSSQLALGRVGEPSKNAVYCVQKRVGHAATAVTVWEKNNDKDWRKNYLEENRSSPEIIEIKGPDHGSAEIQIFNVL